MKFKSNYNFLTGLSTGDTLKIPCINNELILYTYGLSMFTFEGTVVCLTGLNVEFGTQGFVLILFLCLGDIIPVSGLAGAINFSMMVLFCATILGSSISRMCLNKSINFSN